MKRILLIFTCLTLLISLAACGNQQANPEPTEASTETTTETTTEAFDLEAYKQVVKKCRDDIMTNVVYLYNAGRWELSYLNALGRTSDNTVDGAFSWLEKNSDANRETVDLLHETIREEYTELILWEIDGKEASELDQYIRSMYDGYSSLYDCVTSNEYTYSLLNKEINNSISIVDDADDSLSLFLD